MLVLSSKIGSSVKIVDSDGNVVCTVTVNEYDRGTVSLGFEAPRDVRIYRDVIWQRMQQAKTADD